jgi:hypothetical protein
MLCRYIFANSFNASCARKRAESGVTPYRIADGSSRVFWTKSQINQISQGKFKSCGIFLDKHTLQTAFCSRPVSAKPWVVYSEMREDVKLLIENLKNYAQKIKSKRSSRNVSRYKSAMCEYPHRLQY